MKKTNKNANLRTANSNLHRASAVKNDEYYTRLTDIEKELGHYKEHFKNKVVFCNCDDPKESNFFKYFALNFKFLGLKKLISTHYNKGSNSYKLEVTEDINNDGVVNLDDAIKTELVGDGDFRSDECIEILKEADIVVTNPPFSLFRGYIALLMKYNKNFLIIGNINSISYNECFELIKSNKMWLGYTTVRHFVQPNGEIYETARTFWYTNLDIIKRHEDFVLYKKYSKNDYQKYDNFDAIEVSKAIEMPIDYKGVMGVPITFLDKYNPEQFEIVGKMSTTCIDDFNFGYPYINGKKIYARILIKNKRIQNGN